MDVVIDANVLFAALIKEGVTRRLLISDMLTLYAPEFILEEVEKYEEFILQKTEKSKEELQRVLAVLRRRITFVRLSELVPFLDKAKQISPDEKDISYFALALRLSLPIWSNDAALKQKQHVVKVYSTKEVARQVA